LVERHAFVDIQGFWRGEIASLVLACDELTGQEHDGRVDAVSAQFGK
jgi:hypothetical protein